MVSIDGEVKYLKGVGEFRAKLLKKVGVETFLDVMEYFPRAYIDRNSNVKISDIENDTNVALVAKIEDVYEQAYGKNKRKLHAVVSDGTDSLMLTWFQHNKWLNDKLKIGKEVWVSGQVSIFMNSFNIVHPEIEFIDGESIDDDFWKNRPLLPIYRLTGNLTNKALRKIVLNCFSEYSDFIEENLPANILQKFKLKDRRSALQIMHFATTETTAQQTRKRFAFEELFYTQILLARTKFRHKKIVKGLEFKLFHTYTTKLKSSLPYELTGAQKRVINEIVQDMTTTKQMNRLVQGDVGSGKTIVTLFCMLLAVENGYQAIMMVPTEILAEQHFATISNYLSNQPELKIALLKGGVYKGKKKIKAGIKEGEFQIIIGTHALIQDDVEFCKAGFLVVDEQHRFGVEQRAKLSQKMNFPDMLYLSATPIPRSLALTVYGDLDVSQIDELPPTRKPVKTIWHGEAKKKHVYHEIEKELEKGRQAYVVCPLVEESEKMDLHDAQSVFQRLQEVVFPKYRIALLHGRMKSSEKDSIMLAYKNHEFDVLVSTTVIEVGVDVPNASVMMIEHAERFGLSQIHQLRGRVGRGSDEAFCYLISYPPISAEGRERLQTMTSTNDGFLIAEKDLELRGPGDFFGKEQSGMPKFKFASIINDQKILLIARDEAFQIIENDPHLEKDENRLVKDYYFKKFFEREKLIRY
jgi:ATP-dependent DNA helicase RecG